MNERVGVINAGAWGTAIGKNLAEKGYPVAMWDYMPKVVEDINRSHTNSQYLLGIRLPENLTATTDIAEAAADKDFLIVATPSMFIQNITSQLALIPGVVAGKPAIGVLTKGFIASPQGPRLILPTMETLLPESYRDNLTYISGPSHAEEVAQGKLTGLISASRNGKNSIRFRELLSSPRMMVFSSFDTVGVQTCGAVKNVVAVAFGILSALKEIIPGIGDNTESLLLAAGLNEIQNIGAALGSTHPETFTSIAGVGDLEVTCRSEHGRNLRFGREIVKDRILSRFSDLDDLIKNWHQLGYLSEGAVAAKFVDQLAAAHNLKLPICKTVYTILNRKSEPLQAINTLLKNLPGGA